MSTKALILVIMVLRLEFCRLENVPKLDITCSSDLMMVKLQFQQPFKGMIYAIDHPWDPACSFRVPPLADMIEISLKLPLASCGTQIDFTPNGHSIISNKIRVQQHSMLRTVNDTITPVSCSVLGLHKSFADPRTSDIEDLQVEESNMEALLEIDMGQDLLGADLATRLDLFDAPILVFRAQNIGKYQDIDIQNCMIHEREVSGADSVIFQVIHPLECDENIPKMISTFTVFNATNKDELVAYAQLKYLSRLSLVENMHITCEAQLCRRICTPKCSTTTSNNLFTSVASHKITKRNVEEEIKKSSTKQPLDIRSRLLKATVKILSSRLMQKVEEEKSRDVSFHKRSEVMAEINGQPDQEQLSFQSFIKDTTQKSKMQRREPRMSNAEPLEKTGSSTPTLKTEISQNTPKVTKKKLSDKNRDMMKDLARKLASRSQKLKEHNEKFQDLIKTAKEENFPLYGIATESSNLNEAVSTRDEVSTDYDTFEDASFDNRKIKRNKLYSVEEASSSQTDSESYPDEISTTEDMVTDVTEEEDLLSTSIIQDELEQTDSSNSVTEDLNHETTQVQIIPQEQDLIHEPTLIQTIPQDLMHEPTLVPTNSQNMTHEPALIKTTPQDIILSYTKEPDFIHNNIKEKIVEFSVNTTENIDHEQELSKLQENYKKSQLTFFIVTLVLSFIVFTLIATVCGLVLYLNKEKKRRTIDNFLLYNFY